MKVIELTISHFIMPTGPHYSPVALAAYKGNISYSEVNGVDEHPLPVMNTVVELHYGEGELKIFLIVTQTFLLGKVSLQMVQTDRIACSLIVDKVEMLDGNIVRGNEEEHAD